MASWLLRRRLRFRVSGRSMAPVLEPNDEVLLDPRAVPRVGDIVVARHPHRVDVRLIKQIKEFDEAGRAVLAGVNPEESTDSRTLGGVPMELLVGRVTSLLSRDRGDSESC